MNMQMMSLESHTTTLDDMFNVPWIHVKICNNVDDALQLWQCMFKDVINKHIPKKSKRG